MPALSSYPPMMRWRLWAIAVGLTTSMLAAGCKGRAGEAARSGGAIPVSAAEVVRKDMPVVIQTFGTVEAFQTVTMRSQGSGVLTNAAVGEGQDVQAGDLLFQIDARPFLADLAKAEAALARSRVQHANAEKEATRQAELLKKGLTAQDSFDAARTAADALAAAVSADAAAVENARLQLAYCTICAPLEGRTGERLADAGNLVKANDAALLTINQVRPIKVRFAVPQQELENIMAELAAGALTVQAVIPALPDEPETGAVTFLDNTVDSATGTIRLKGVFANERRRLWPGQFVRVNLVLKTDPAAVVVPAEAVLAGQQGRYVYVINPDLTVANCPVTVARRAGGEIVIADGLEAGWKVVTDGQLRLGPGSRVEIK